MVKSMRSIQDKEQALAISLGAGLFGLGLSWWRAPRTPAGFAAAVGLTCFLLAAFGKKAFLNYYFLVVAALLTAVAASADESVDAHPATTPPSDSNASDDTRPQ